MDGPPLLIQTVDPDVLRVVMRRRGELAGGRVRRLRVVGPTTFCAAIGVPLQTLHKIETGEIVPRDHLKAAIALALGVEMSNIWPWPTLEEIRADSEWVTA